MNGTATNAKVRAVLLPAVRPAPTHDAALDNVDRGAHTHGKEASTQASHQVGHNVVREVTCRPQQQQQASDTCTP